MCVAAFLGDEAKWIYLDLLAQKNIEGPDNDLGGWAERDTFADGLGRCESMRSRPNLVRTEIRHTKRASGRSRLEELIAANCNNAMLP